MKQCQPMDILNIYHNEIPEFIERIVDCAVFQRLKGIGMNCGCEYTWLPAFRNLEQYDRYAHSIGVALIVWHFTNDIKASVAGLLHDISTPAFAHVIDFLNNDYLTQESIEASTLDFIKSSDELVTVLSDYGLAPEDVCDYHRFPIADNDSPKLSADRLEYTLGNSLNFKFATFDTIQRLYNNITVEKNEDDINELAFSDPDAASEFANLSLSCSKIYVSDQDRYAMQILSELISKALGNGTISRKDLYDSEENLIRKLRSSKTINLEWNHFTHLSEVSPSGPGPQARMIVAKKRYINPLAKDRGRVTDFDRKYKTELDLYLGHNLEYWIEGTFE